MDESFLALGTIEESVRHTVFHWLSLNASLLLWVKNHVFFAFEASVF